MPLLRTGPEAADSIVPGHHCELAPSDLEQHPRHLHGQLHGQHQQMARIPTQQVAAQPNPEMTGVHDWGQVPEQVVHITSEHKIAQLKALLEEKEALLSRLGLGN